MKQFDEFVDSLKRPDEPPANSTHKEITEQENVLNSVEKNDCHIAISLESDKNTGLFYERIITDLTGEIIFLKDQINKSDTNFKDDIKFIYRSLQNFINTAMIKQLKCMRDYAKLGIRENKPDHIILHVGTSNQSSKKKMQKNLLNLFQISSKIVLKSKKQLVFPVLYHGIMNETTKRKR